MNTHGQGEISKLEFNCPKPHSLVKFENVKKNYYTNEDIILIYTIEPEVITSSHDWVGLYPRGWGNMQQYIAFEWANGYLSEDIDRKRKILFRHKYHSQVVGTNRDYQFLYVNKQIKVLGCSSYFQFVASDPLLNIINPEIYSVEHCSSLNYTSKRQGPSFPCTLMKPASISTYCEPARSVSEISFSKVDSLNSNSLLREATCIHCRKHIDPDRKHQVLISKLKSADDNITNLKARIVTLQNSLQEEYMKHKKMKMAINHAKKEKLAYQSFVNEMIQALHSKGIVRVVDGQGSEVLVKKVQSCEEELQTTDADKKDKNTSQSSMARITHRERLLKAVIGSQEQTIRELLNKLDCCGKDSDETEELKTDTCNIELFEEESEGFKNIPQSLVAILPSQNKCISKTEVQNDLNKKIQDGEHVYGQINAAILVDNIEKDSDKIEKKLSITSNKPEAETDLCEEIMDIVEKDENVEVKKTSEKPKALVIQGNNMQFAIIRY